MLKKNFALSVMARAVAGVAQASQQKAAEASMEHVYIIGSKDVAKTLPGSAFVIDEAELEKFEYSDIHRILRQVPGVYVAQEDGYGLRPNIGIRGAGGHRAEKITLMEDGVLIAPAPYSGPAAYYFPTTGRMSGIEVLKGPESIEYGPYTVGGAVNLISTPIPKEAAGMVQVEVGEDGEDRIHAWYGDSAENFGWLLETHQQNADGFKDIDRSSRNAGIDKEDYMAKFRINTDGDARYYNQLDLKLQYSTEVSNMSYLGLTDADFKADPNRRYGLSELDQMDNEHKAVTLSHYIAFSDNVSLSTTAYYNEFERDWFKLDGGSAYIDAANAGDATAQGILDGSIDVAGLGIKHNAREYESYGVQTELEWRFNLAGMAHKLDVGARWHEDEVDRYQPTEIYDQVNGSLVYQGVNLPSASNNRVQEGEALSFFIMDHIEVTEKLDVTAAIRYEDIETTETRYSDLQARNVVDSKKSNSTDEVILGLGATYQINDQWSILAGVHEGFAPADGGAENLDPEESVNWEAGLRYSNDALFVEMIGFLSDFSSFVQNCTVAAPCGTQDFGSVKGGEAEIQGIEFLVNYDFAAGESYSIPVSFTYTYTDAEITKGSADGDFLKGDVIQEVPENQWAASIGYVAASGWDAYLNASYTDSTCIDNTCGRAGVDDTLLETDDLLVFDLSASYPLNDAARVYVKVDNVFDEQEMVSRLPDGARANKPRTAYVGVKVNF
jgi:Fe(3+) dicitrate transport protein